MEYKVIYGDSPSELNEKINSHLKDGWKLSGSHQVVIRRQQNRFRGDQHMDTLNELEYSQTIVKETEQINDINKEVILVLETILEDAEMALSGEWDCTTQEGMESGFNSQIRMINDLLDKLK